MCARDYRVLVSLNGPRPSGAAWMTGWHVLSQDETTRSPAYSLAPHHFLVVWRLNIVCL